MFGLEIQNVYIHSDKGINHGYKKEVKNEVRYIKKDVRTIKRFNHILLVLFKNGFEGIVDKIKLKSKVSFRHKIKSKINGRVRPEVRLRRTFEELGPTFIKLGQLLSIRPDLIPNRYVKELGKLQDKVPPFEFDVAKKEVEEELKQPLEKVFKKFSKKPVASASVSQVYKAELMNGNIVAVKVQRPGVDEVMEADIEIMIKIASLIEKYNLRIKKYNPTGIIKEFKEWTEKEIDFRNEAKNAHVFYKNFKDNDKVHIPKVYDGLTTRKILVLEFIEGIELHDIKKLKRKKYDIKKIIKDGFDVIVTQVFIHGFFHGDPHPGNILVLKNEELSFVDYGIVGRFDKNLRKRSIELLCGIVEKDVDRIIDTFIQMGAFKKNINIDSFKEELENVINPIRDIELDNLKVSRFLENVLDVALKYKIKMPTDFALFGKTIVTLEGIGLQYDPNFEFYDNIEPFIEKLIKREYNYGKMMKDITKSIIKFKKFIQDFPDQANKVFRKIQEGRVKVDVKDTDIKTLSIEIDKSSNRLAYGMIIAALVVAGSLVINVDMPRLIGIPMLSLLFFLAACVLGFMLLVSILREKKLK